MLHAIESPHKVEMPIAAAELAIGDIWQAMRLLLLDDLSNQAVFYAAEVGGRNLAISKLGSCFFQLCRTQIAAHCLKMYISLNRLSLSPQCGFASCEIGNKLTDAEQWAKIDLVREISEEVWGSSSFSDAE